MTPATPEYVALVTFICGPAFGRPSVRKKCRFCDCRDAKALCDWPILKPTMVRTEDLNVGDAWITQQSRKRGKIVEIHDLDINGRRTNDDFVSRQFWVLIPGHPRPYPYRRLNGDRILSERPGTCDNACCHRHRRHVGPDRDYCLEHWNAWKEVA